MAMGPDDLVTVSRLGMIIETSCLLYKAKGSPNSRLDAASYRIMRCTKRGRYTASEIARALREPASKGKSRALKILNRY